MKRPLRLTGLAGDERDGIRGRRSDDRLTEVVEQREVLGPLPHEGDRVAIDVAKVCLGFLLLRESDRGWRDARLGDDVARRVGRQPLLIHRVLVIRRDADST